MDVRARILQVASCVKSKENEVIFVEKGYKFVICISCYIKIFIDLFNRYAKKRNLHVINCTAGVLDPLCKICKKVLLSFGDCSKCEKCLAVIHQFGQAVVEEGVVDLNDPVILEW